MKKRAKRETTEKRGVKFFMKRSISDLFSKKTVLLVLVDIATLFAVIIAIAVGMFAFKDSFTTLLGVLPSLTLMSQEGFLDQKTSTELVTAYGEIKTVREKLNKIILDSVRSLLVGMGLIFAGIAFCNQLIWKMIKKVRLTMGLFGRFYLTTFLVFVLWTVLFVLTSKLFNFKAAVYAGVIEIILCVNLLQVLYSGLEGKKGVWLNLWECVKNLGKKIKDYLLAVIITFVISILAINVFILIFFKVPAIAAIGAYIGLLLYLNWTRYYFNLLSPKKRGS